MKLLWYGETPYIETGAGQVAKNLLPVFQKYFDAIHLVAINQWWKQPDLPDGLRITWVDIPAEKRELTDIWSVPNIKSAIAAYDYDCLFLTTDLNRITELTEGIQGAKDRGIPVLIYAAMDTHIFNPEFFRVLTLATYPVVFSEWCKRLVSFLIPELECKVIYHGCEPDVFHPLPADERRGLRKHLFNIDDDQTFLVLNVARNQVRKDLARSMAAFHLFYREYPHSALYLHSKQMDMGGHLPSQALGLGIRIHGENPEIIFAPEAYNESSGVPRDELNNLYNCADVCISTSTGEGWGLTTTESMAAGTPFIGPANTVFPEILGGKHRTGDLFTDVERGVLVESGGPELWATFYGVCDNPRELCSTLGMKAALEYVYHYRAEAQVRAINARAWTCEHSWEHIQKQWEHLIHNALTGPQVHKEGTVTLEV
jgi:glycosyltransferase involved in cell wall biosynthesis